MVHSFAWRRLLQCTFPMTTERTIAMLAAADVDGQVLGVAPVMGAVERLDVNQQLSLMFG